ncbi:hypothetical protein O181_022301 [Austropuccinia psidii MF-1]|uniref:Uncharacterized protein n=1 Tax=Austropuccinia psidii MF-1 TaxID=1389203 RepID=A0A9Q3CH62_9BASI|nr:hypothetical protein [Austropuccinia psidii MF-1]
MLHWNSKYQDPPFMSIPGELAFSIYVYWSNAHGKSTWLVSIGPIMLICLSLPKRKIKSRECLCCRNDPWPKGANFPSFQLPINATNQGSQRAMVRLPFSTHLNRSFRIPYMCFHPYGHCSQYMSVDENNLPNTRRKMGQSEEIENEITKNTFHLISAINISTRWTVSMDDDNVFAEHWKKFHLSSQHLFSKQKSKPNHHFSDHIPELF